MAKQLRFFSTLLLLAVASIGWADTYTQLTSISDIDESAQYVLGIEGTGFHYEGTSSWGKTALPSAQTPIYYTLTKADDGKSFTAKAEISGTTYYLQIPTSNIFAMATSTGTNTDIIIGTTQVSETNYAVANKTTTARHLRINGTNGLRSYAGTTGSMAFFYKVVKASTPTVSFSIESKTILVGETYTQTVKTENAEGATVVYSSSDTGIATVDSSTGEVTGVSVGEATISASITIDGTDYVATYTIKVVQVEDGVFDFTQGDIDYGSGITTTNNTSVEASTATWTAGNVTLTTNGKFVWYQGNSSYDLRFYNDNASAFTLSVPAGKVITKIVIVGSGKGNFTASVGAYSEGTWTGSANSVTFTRDGNSGGKAIQTITVTYGEGAEKADAGLAYAETSLTKNVGDADFVNELTNPNGLTVTYSSSDEAVATVDADGTVTIKAEGTTTITATFAGDDEYNAGSASYTLKVEDPNKPGSTKENPYTVAQARDAIDAGEGVTGVYAKGVISQIDSYNEKYGSITYWISEDGTTTADQLEVYGGLGIDKAKFKVLSDLQLGDVVVVYGNLKKYNSTYEFDSNNYLVSLEREAAKLAFTQDGEEISEITLNVDDMAEVVLNCAIDGATVTVESSDKTIAEYDEEDGVIYAYAEGVVTITATAVDDNAETLAEATLKVTVVDNTKGTTEEKAYSVADVVALGSEVTQNDAWVKGYIVGVYSNNKFTSEAGTVKTNIALADSPDETETTIPVQLEDNYLRAALNLAGNAGMKGVQVLLKGQVTKYFNVEGMKAPQTAKIFQTIGAAEYSTMYYGSAALAVNEDVLVSYISDAKNGALTETEISGVIPAGTGVLLYGEAGTYTFEVSKDAAEAITDNLLRGTDEAATTTADVDSKFYMLSLNANSEAGSVGFYFAKGCPNGEAFTNGAHKAYLAVPKADASTKGYAIGDDATGIESLTTTSTTGEGSIYNLAGQRVAKAQKGVYIVGGKKIVVR